MTQLYLPFDGLIPTTSYDLEAVALADRHYNRRSGQRHQVGGPAKKLILRDSIGSILFIWLWPRRGKRWDGQEGYYCSLFRNESVQLSSEVILEAEHHAMATWGPNRAFTYVDPSKVRSSNPGFCFLKAGWHRETRTKSGKVLLVKELV